MFSGNTVRKISMNENTMGIVAIILIQVFIFIPATLYLGNSGQFNITILEMLRLTAIPASILFLFLVIAEQYLSSNIRSRVIVVLAVLSIVIWIQSNVLVWEYGVLAVTNMCTVYIQ